MKTIKNFLEANDELLFMTFGAILTVSALLISGHYLIKFFELATGH